MDLNSKFHAHRVSSIEGYSIEGGGASSHPYLGWLFVYVKVSVTATSYVLYLGRFCLLCFHPVLIFVLVGEQLIILSKMVGASRTSIAYFPVDTAVHETKWWMCSRRRKEHSPLSLDSFDKS